jgi:tetratricopeptide (TPR) repeat protein
MRRKLPELAQQFKAFWGGIVAVVGGLVLAATALQNLWHVAQGERVLLEAILIGALAIAAGLLFFWKEDTQALPVRRVPVFPRLRWGMVSVLILALAFGVSWWWQGRSTGKLVVLVADFDYFHPSQHFGLTQRIVERLRAATKADSDIDVQVLGKPIPWEQGSAGARSEGAKRDATIVIWGDYKAPKGIASFTVHFEMLKTPPPAPIPPDSVDLVPPSLLREGTVSVADLESFTIQEQLSGQMVYLTLLVSGLARSVKGDWSHAIDRFSQAIRAPEPKGMIGSEVIYFLRGTAYGMLGHDAEADADLSKSIEINPKLGIAFNNRGIVRGFIRGERDVDSAISDFTRAIELNSCNDKALVNRGVLWRQSGNIVGAIHDYDLAIQCDPKNYKPFVGRGVARAFNGQLQQAFEDYTRALELNPGCVEAFDDRGSAFYEQGNVDRAIADYTRAIRIDPKRAEALFNRGNAWCAKGDPKRGVDDYNKVIALRPAWASAFYRRGNAYRQLQLVDLAIGDYSKAIELDPGFLLAYKGRIVARLIVREYRGAFADMSHICLADTDAAERKFACYWLKYGEGVMHRWGGDGNGAGVGPGGP